MSRHRFLLLLVAALVAICGAVFLSTQRDRPADMQGGALLPFLANQINAVSEISVHKGSPTATVTVRKRGVQWTVAERGNFPADVSKLRRLLLSLKDAKIIEEKTSNSASYPVIGVEDPTQAGAGGVQVDIVAEDGKHAVIIGKSSGAGSFVRRGGEIKSYIVQPAISVETEPRFWIDTPLLDLKVAQIERIDVKSATGPVYSVSRAAPPAATGGPPQPGSAKSAAATSDLAVPSNFALAGVPVGRKAADPQSLAPSPTTYSSLGIEDVAEASTIDFTKPSTVTVTLRDGDVITMTGAVSGDKRWIEVSSVKDAALNAKTAARAFEISNFRYDAIFRPLEQLLVPLPPPEPKKHSSAAPSPAVPPFGKKLPGAQSPATNSSPAKP